MIYTLDEMSGKSSDHPYTITLEQARAMAKTAAQEALAESRAAAKKGRNDTGSGDTLIGVYTYRRRNDLGLTIAQAAEQAGIHPTFWSKIEDGKRGMSLATFAKMGLILGHGWRMKVLDRVVETCL